MNSDNWIDLAVTAVTLLVGVLAAEGLTFKSRARRRAKLAAEVVSALPENTMAHSIALSIAEHEVGRWRLYAAPTPAERAQKAQRWERLNLWASVIGGSATGMAAVIAVARISDVVPGGTSFLVETPVVAAVLAGTLAVLASFLGFSLVQRDKRGGSGRDARPGGRSEQPN